MAQTELHRSVTVAVGDGDVLGEADDEQRPSSHIVVHQLQQVDASL